jgi:phytoene synthase
LERRQRLDAWLDAFHRAEAGHPTDDPVLLALTDTQRRYKIPVELLDQLAYGTGMDIQDGETASAPGSAELQVLYRTFSDLRQYCYRVASVVGLVCIRIFGYRDPAAEALAENLGLAFQLTNIIRDIQEDADMGRIYLPAEDLERFKIGPDDFRQSTIPERLRWLLAAEADRAREYYISARELMTLIDEDSQPALWVLVTIYRRLLEKISDRKYDVFGKKISLTVREKVVILGKGLVKRLA